MEINGLFIRQALRGALALATVAFLWWNGPVYQFADMETTASGDVSGTFIDMFGNKETMISLQWLPVMVSVIKWALALIVFLWLSTAAWTDHLGEPVRRRREQKRRRRAGKELSE